MTPNSDVVAPNAGAGFGDDSENADDASLDEVKKLGMDELEPKAADEEVADSSLSLLVACAGGVAKENEFDFDELGSSGLVPNENVDTGPFETPKAAAGAGESSLGLVPLLKVGAEVVPDDENEKAL